MQCSQIYRRPMRRSIDEFTLTYKILETTLKC